MNVIDKMVPVKNLTGYETNLYIASNAILCYDPVLCYLSNVVTRHYSDDIQTKLRNYFSYEQLDQAFYRLHQCIQYVQSTIDAEKDRIIDENLFECSKALTDLTCLTKVMERIRFLGLSSYFPVFVAHYWLDMIEQPTDSTMKILIEQMVTFNNNLTTFYHLFSHSPSMVSNEQCCLTTNCRHNSTIPSLTTRMDSAHSSSWSSLNMETSRGVIRNPVTNFLIPIVSSGESDFEGSIASIDERNSSDDENDEEQTRSPPIFLLNRSLSHQPMSSPTGSIVVKRQDQLWVYPAGFTKPKSNLLFSSVCEENFLSPPILTRANSYDDRFHQLNSMKNLRKSKKSKAGWFVQRIVPTRKSRFSSFSNRKKNISFFFSRSERDALVSTSNF